MLFQAHQTDDNKHIIYYLLAKRNEQEKDDAQA